MSETFCPRYPQIPTTLSARSTDGRVLTLKMHLPGIPQVGYAIAWHSDYAALSVRNVNIGQHQLDVRLDGLIDADSVEDYRVHGWDVT